MTTVMRRRQPTPAGVADAASALREGHLVAFPTETVYGLGADATNEQAVAAIFAAKGRPRFNPLIVHVGSAADGAAFGRLDSRASMLAERFWPGPLTLVLPRRPQSGLSLLVSAGLDNVALRVPAHPVAQALLSAVARPLAAPSANPSGTISPTSAAHVEESLGDAVAVILDAGPCAIGLESTVVDLTADEPTLLRPGGLPSEVVAEALGRPLAESGDPEHPRSPGMLRRHYAPATPLRLDATEVDENEALLAFGDEAPQGAAATRNLSPAGNLHEAAANLFGMLRILDRRACRRIAVVPIPEHGLGVAINDRLRRAAATDSGRPTSDRGRAPLRAAVDCPKSAP